MISIQIFFWQPIKNSIYSMYDMQFIFPEIHRMVKLAELDETEKVSKEAKQILSHLVHGQLPDYEEQLRKLTGQEPTNG
jgi:hypothetical protein